MLFRFIFLVICFSYLFSNARAENRENCIFAEDPEDGSILLEFKETSLGSSDSELPYQMICKLIEEPAVLVSYNNLGFKVNQSTIFSFFIHATNAYADDGKIATNKIYKCRNENTKIKPNLEMRAGSDQIAYLGLLTCRRTSYLNFNICLYNWRMC